MGMALRDAGERGVLALSRSGGLRAMSEFAAAGCEGKRSLLDADLGAMLSLLRPPSFAQ
jgi:hypothetical protein